MPEETEVEKLRKENRQLKKNLEYAEETIAKLREMTLSELTDYREEHWVNNKPDESIKLRIKELEDAIRFALENFLDNPVMEGDKYTTGRIKLKKAMESK